MNGINRKNIYVYGYKNIDPKYGYAISYSDSFTNNRFRDGIYETSNFPPVYFPMDEVNLATINEDGIYKEIIPDFVVAYDEISDNIVKESKRLNIPIVLLKRKIIDINPNDFLYDNSDYYREESLDNLVKNEDIQIK